MARRVAIIGGGPAGLSLARLFRDNPDIAVTVFEAGDQVGGKSFSFMQGEAVVEMGTCYTTRAHRHVLQWMKESGIHLRALKEQSFDGEDFLDYVKRGEGPSLPVQILRFLHDRRRLMKALDADPLPAWARDEAAQTIADWLRKRNLHKIERFMYRSLTNLGYGFVDETPTVQAMRWNDLDLILTGLLKQLKMPVEGWTVFWQRVAKGLDVRTGARITRISRSPEEIILNLQDGSEFRADQLVCAMPIDEFIGLTDPTDSENFVASSIKWNGYTTTLVATPERFTDVNVAAWSRALLPGADEGQIMSARYDGFEAELGGHLYLTGQLSGDYTDAELVELLGEEISREGGAVSNVILQKNWKYFAQYNPDAIRNGLLTRMRKMQGEQSTWYTGAAFSHEAVSNIVNFNAGLARKMQQSV